MSPRRTLPTIRQNWPLWRRAARELVRLIVVGWARVRLRCVVEEERGYRVAGQVNGYRIGTSYRQNCRDQRRQLRAVIEDWNR